MIAFNKYYNHFNLLSSVLIVASLLLLIFKGLNYGIDFKGGTLIELRASDSKINVSSLRDRFNQMDLGEVSVKKFGNDTDFLVKFENKDNKKNIIAAIHAGWKGAYKNIVHKVVVLFKKKGSSINNLYAVIGPCITKKNYEIQKDFKDKFIKKNKKK